MESSRQSRGRHVRRNLRQRRARQLVLCLAAVALAVPALFAKAPADAQDSAATEQVVAGQQRAHPWASLDQALADSATASTTTSSTVPATTNTTVPPTVPATTAPPVEPVQWQAPTTTAPPATAPPTTAPPATSPPTTRPAPRRPAHSESGIASYYDDPNGGCAHKTLPFGTVVHITASNGRTATCVVDDRGPFGAGRILDLDTSIFSQLAPTSAGLVRVTATW